MCGVCRAEGGIGDVSEAGGLGEVYRRQVVGVESSEGESCDVESWMLSRGMLSRAMLSRRC